MNVKEAIAALETLGSIEQMAAALVSEAESETIARKAVEARLVILMVSTYLVEFVRAMQQGLGAEDALLSAIDGTRPLV